MIGPSNVFARLQGPRGVFYAVTPRIAEYEQDKVRFTGDAGKWVRGGQCQMYMYDGLLSDPWLELEMQSC